MKKAVLFSVVLLFVGTAAYSQTTPGARVFDGSVELMSYVGFAPREVNGKKYQTEEASIKSRFDMVNLNNGCRTGQCIVYGDRYGINWDIFSVWGGATPQTRMVPIGEYKWTDNFTVPHVEPWAVLAPGETRTIMGNTSGGDGADGRPGASGSSGAVAQVNGGSISAPRAEKRPSYATASVDRQVSSMVTTADGKTRKDSYSPVVEAKLGYMYVVRVKDATRDFYLLVRVDELKRGERVVLSYKKLELP